MKIGFILKGLRLLKGATQQYIAVRLNVERSTYCKWETNKITVNVKNLQNLANIYGLNLEFMVKCIEAKRLLFKNDVLRFIKTAENQDK